MKETATGLFIDGAFHRSTGRLIPQINPATEEIFTEVSAATVADVDRAMTGAQRAFEGGWRDLAPGKRAELLFQVARAIRDRAEALAQLECLNIGKPISDARDEIALGARVFEYYAGAIPRFFGQTIPVSGGGFDFTWHEPMGVVAAIVPWNFPFPIACWKVAPALAAGNCVVLKPASQSPLTALELGALAHQAGLPAGALQVLPGSGTDIGDALVLHPQVRKISFTGSTAVGARIMELAARDLKRVSLELGGKSPNIVFADADLEAAARGAINGIFFNKGEVCCAGSRLFVEESVHEALLEKILKRVEKLQPGDPLNPKTRLGPVVSQEQMDKVMGYIESGKSEGAQLRAGGAAGQVTGKPGYFVQPTVFDHVEDSMKIAREEIFGPVLSVVRFSDLKSAVSRSNASFYGLAAGVWTRDIKKAHQTAKLLRAGTVWINTYNILDCASPFGGYKMSGFGRDLGVHALEQYTNIKSVWVDLSE